MSGVSKEDYEHANRTWKEFGLKELGEYHDLYLKTDVILLANVFEAFRKVCLKNYELDPAHFYTALGLAWKACLKKTRIRLELLLYPDMLLMFERGIRGGITQSVNRWAKANNPYMGSDFTPDKPTKYLQYLDANNLYGWAMSQPLPTGGFKWVSIKPSKISQLAKRKSTGYLLKVDVRYPSELHDSHNDLPFMYERMKINGVEKLIPNLYDKKRYIIHIRALDQGCEMKKIKVVMNKPVYLGQAILDLSKIVVYEFHYDYMKQKYPEGLTLCYMDTDSLIYDIETDDFYKDIAEDVKDRFDTSGYNPNQPLPVGLNKKMIGLMKNELGGEIMTEFVTLRPKMYAYKTGESESKKCKGIKKCVVRKTISFEDYKASVFSGETSYRSQLMFRSSKHKVKTLEVNKLALSRDDDKHITVNGINSLARGLYNVKNIISI